MRALDVTPDALDAVLVTHEQRRSPEGRRTPVEKARRAGLADPRYLPRRPRPPASPRCGCSTPTSLFRIATSTSTRSRPPHDAAESCQFVFARGRRALRHRQPTSAPAPRTCARSSRGSTASSSSATTTWRCSGTVPYPAQPPGAHPRRLGPPRQRAGRSAARRLDHDALSCILLGHLSERNNSTPSRSPPCSRTLDGGHERVSVLAQHCASTWFGGRGADRGAGARGRCRAERDARGRRDRRVAGAGRAAAGCRPDAAARSRARRGGRSGAAPERHAAAGGRARGAGGARPAPRTDAARLTGRADGAHPMELA